jgi:hypothetical protein
MSVNIMHTFDGRNAVRKGRGSVHILSMTYNTHRKLVSLIFLPIFLFMDLEENSQLPEDSQPQQEIVHRWDDTQSRQLENLTINIGNDRKQE